MYVLVNDIFDELFNENKRLLNELLFADKCIKVLNKIKRFLDLNSNEIKVNLVSKQLKAFNDLLQTIEEVFREKNSFVIEVKEEVIEKNIRFNKRIKSSVKKNPKLIIIKEKNKSNDKNTIKVVSMKKNEIKRIETKADNNLINSQWVCDYEDCGQRFRGEKSLRYHLWRHQKAVESERNKCQYPGCTFKCNHITKLVLHERKHTGETPFECNECHNKFKSEVNLRLHTEKIHELLSEPIVCTVDDCNRQFRSEASFKAHQKVLVGVRMGKLSQYFS